MGTGRELGCHAPWPVSPSLRRRGGSTRHCGSCGRVRPSLFTERPLALGRGQEAPRDGRVPLCCSRGQQGPSDSGGGPASQEGPSGPLPNTGHPLGPSLERTRQGWWTACAEMGLTQAAPMGRGAKGLPGHSPFALRLPGCACGRVGTGGLSLPPLQGRHICDLSHATRFLRPRPGGTDFVTLSRPWLSWSPALTFQEINLRVFQWAMFRGKMWSFPYRRRPVIPGEVPSQPPVHWPPACRPPAGLREPTS